MTIHVTFVVPLFIASVTLGITYVLHLRAARRMIDALESLSVALGAEVDWYRTLNAWLEAREPYFEKMVLAAKYAMASRIPPDSFGQFFKFGMLSKEGVAAAPHLYEQHKAMIVVHREVTQEIRDAYEALARWEAANPVPLRSTFEVEEDQPALVEGEFVKRDGTKSPVYELPTPISPEQLGR